MRKTDVLKTSIFSEEIHYLWRAKRCKVYSEKRVFWHFRLQLSFVYKSESQISFNFFWSGDKRLLSEFLRKWDRFHGHNGLFPFQWTWNENFKKQRRDFVDERGMITTTLTSSCFWKNLAPFCLRNKRSENALLTVTVSYRKIVQNNKLCYSKQQ